MMGFEDEADDVISVAVNAPIFCPSCNSKLEEGDTGNRVCANGFPPCCYCYWNAAEKKNYWKEGFGPEFVYDDKKKTWNKKEPTEVKA